MSLPSTQGSYAEQTVQIAAADGLHMRPAMQFVECANRFASQISVFSDDHCIDGKSIMQVITLAAVKGTALRIKAEGADAQEAVTALAQLIENAAGEDADKTK